jgi:histidinol-phosphate aminotransferase
MSTPVREAAARAFGARPEMILAGNGSDDLLTIIVRSFVGEGELAVIPDPSYGLYTSLIEIQNGRICYAEYPDDYSMPPGIAQPGAKLTFLCTPNNPSGTSLPPDQVAAAAREISGILVIDEAYADFADTNCLRLPHELENVIVLRSLSKSYSLAGARVGVAIAPQKLIEGMIKVKDSYNLDQLSIVAGATALDDPDYMRANVERIKATRAYLSRQLAKLGFEVFPSQANFILVRSRSMPAKTIYERLVQKSIYVRYWDKPRLSDCLRITVGSPKEVQALLAALSEIVPRSSR